MKAELILKSSCVFTAAGEPPFAGYVALGGGHILAVGHGEPESALIRDNCRILDCGDGTICPGFFDVHCFFTGYAAQKLGLDAENSAQQDAMLRDRERILPLFRDYMRLLNSRGVTSVKEMGFDDFHGFPALLEELEKKGELTLRVSFMSQPIDRPLDLAFGKEMSARFHSDYLRFSGYNRMTDGSISQMEGALKQAYCGTDCLCAISIDWDAIAGELRTADENGFRFSLHAQGDAAIAKVLDLYECCRRDENGRLINRHSITDLEFSDPEDLERMGALGAIAEIYPQIQSIAERESKLAMIREKIGEERGRFYWNRRKMADSGVLLSCGTDLPLLIDDIPESVYHAVGGFFPEGGEPFNGQNTLTAAELLTAWTRGGAYNLFCEDKLGTLEAGKKADITVLSGDLFAVPPSAARTLRVVLTLLDGEEVYNAMS